MTAMSDLDKMARELLTAAYDGAGYGDFVGGIANGHGLSEGEAIACEAIRTALLTAPPGYVLVPAEPSDVQLMWMGGHDDASLRRAYAGLIASAPEPK